MPFKFNPITGNLDVIKEPPVTDFSTISDTLYPSVKAVNDRIATLAAGAESFYFSGTNSDIATYEQMQNVGSYTVGALATQNAVATTSPTLLAVFATNATFPVTRNIPIGLMTCHFETQKSAGSNNYFSFFELYKRSSGGTETLLLTSDNSSSSALNTNIQITLTALNSSIISLASGDRIVVKIYVQMLSSTATITISYDDNTDARFALPASALGYVPEDVANKSTDGTLAANSTTLYPSQSAVKTYADTKVGSLAAIGAVPNANAASLSAGVLNLQPADASFGGVVTTAAQTFAGDKTFNGQVLGKLGSVSSVGFGFTGDIDTGIYSSGANSISLVTAGVERIRVGVSNSGFINIGGNFTSTSHGLLLSGIASNTPSFGIRAANAQSVDLVQFMNFSGTVFGGMTQTGGLFLNTTAAVANKAHHFRSAVATSSVLSLRGFTAQSANVLDIENVAGTVLAGITSGGTIYAQSGSSGTPGFAFATSGSLDSNTGFYTPGADRLAITNNSAQSLEISALGRYHFGANFTADACKVQITTDTTTIPSLGIRLKAAQTADAFRVIDSAGTSVYSAIGNDGVFKGINGSNSQPSFSFNNDLGLGMYKESDNILGFTTNSTKRFTVDENGNLAAYTLHNNATANGNASQQDIRSGSEFAPTFSNLSNVSAVSLERVNWLRVGNCVTVSGYGQMESLSGGNVSFEMDLPVASNFDGEGKLGGAGALFESDTGSNAIMISAEATNDTALFRFFNSSNNSPLFSFTFTYEVQ